MAEDHFPPLQGLRLMREGAARKMFECNSPAFLSFHIRGKESRVGSCSAKPPHFYGAQFSAFLFLVASSSLPFSPCAHFSLYFFKTVSGHFGTIFGHVYFLGLWGRLGSFWMLLRCIRTFYAELSKIMHEYATACNCLHNVAITVQKLPFHAY